VGLLRERRRSNEQHRGYSFFHGSPMICKTRGYYTPANRA
jgi:hypothetical protein